MTCCSASRGLLGSTHVIPEPAADACGQQEDPAICAVCWMEELHRAQPTVLAQHRTGEGTILPGRTGSLFAVLQSASTGSLPFIMPSGELTFQNEGRWGSSR